jgi:drug/metabolite transporter (DMT)-like permease
MSRFAWSLLLIFVTAIWGWTFTVVKDATRDYGVVSFLTLRFALATLLMSSCLRGASFRAWRDGAMLGAVLAASYLLQTFGLAHTSATNCGLITGLFVVFAPLISRYVFGVRAPEMIWLACCLSVLGLALLTATGLEPPRVGDVLTLGASVCLGLHIALLDQVARRHAASTLAAVQFAAATVIFAAVWPATESFAAPPASVWPAIVITGVLATALGFYVQTLVQQRLSAARVAVILTLEPVFATLCGIWLAGDRLTRPQWGGATIMLLAVVLVEIVPKMRRTR